MNRYFPFLVVGMLCLSSVLADLQVQMADDSPWIVDTEVSYNGNPVYRTDALGDGETTTLSVTFEGGNFSSFVKTSTETGCDVLTVSVDGQMWAQWSGNTDWTECSWGGDAGVHTVTFTYGKDGGVASGDDCCWVWFEGIKVEEEPVAEEAFTMDLVSPWRMCYDVTYPDDDGVEHAMLDFEKIPKGCGTSFTHTFPTSQTLSVVAVVTKGEAAGRLDIYCDGVLKGSVAAIDSSELYWTWKWTKVKFRVKAGQRVSFEYWNGSDRTLSDNGGVRLYYNGVERLMEQLETLVYSDTDAYTLVRSISMDMNGGVDVVKEILDSAPGVSYASDTDGKHWRTDVEGAYSGSALRSMEVADGEVSWMSATVVGKGVVSFNWKVSSASDVGVLSVYLDGVLKESISGEQSWTEARIEIADDARHVIKWVFAQNGSATAGSNCGWVDCVRWDAVGGYDDPDEPNVPASGVVFTRLDLRPSPRVVQTEAPSLFVETVVFDPAWERARKVVLKVNGETAGEWTAAGTYDWKPLKAGDYTLTLEQLDANGNPVAAPLTAHFIVKKKSGFVITIL